MSRELKFRCFDKRHKEMFYSDRERRLATFFDMFAGVCRSEIIMQYTELKDSKGNEIYEGDILRIRGGASHYETYEFNSVGYVAYEDACFVLKDKDYTCQLFVLMDGFKTEIIGNIYENRGLLE